MKLYTDFYELFDYDTVIIYEGGRCVFEGAVAGLTDSERKQWSKGDMYNLDSYEEYSAVIICRNLQIVGRSAIAGLFLLV